MNTPSLLTKPMIDTWLAAAQQNVVQDGCLVPVCIMRLANGQGLAVELKQLMITQAHEQKRMQLIHLGKQIRDKGQAIVEAVMIIEGWYVNAKRGYAMTLAPSQHPQRQEAIVVIGRNADQTRTTCVIQPFTRDQQDQPVWEPIPHAFYNEPSTNGLKPLGLVDYLFVHTPTG